MVSKVVLITTECPYFNSFYWHKTACIVMPMPRPLFTHIALQITKFCLHWKSHENLPQPQRLKLLCLKQATALQYQVGAKYFAS